MENEVTFFNPDNDANELHNNHSRGISISTGVDSNGIINDKNEDNEAMHLVHKEGTSTLKVKDTGNDYHYGTMFGLEKDNEYRVNDFNENNEEICNPLTINMNTGCRGKRDGRLPFQLSGLLF